MDDRERLSNAIGMATLAFLPDFDKQGKPAVLHAYRVGMAGKTMSEQIVGYLHDVVEDNKFEMAAVRLGAELTWEESDALLFLTHMKAKHSYEEYIEMIADSLNLIAINVKLNDLEDNMTRGGASVQHMAKYAVAKTKLREARARLNASN